MIGGWAGTAKFAGLELIDTTTSSPSWLVPGSFCLSCSIIDTVELIRPKEEDEEEPWISPPDSLAKMGGAEGWLSACPDRDESDSDGKGNGLFGGGPLESEGWGRWGDGSSDLVSKYLHILSSSRCVFNKPLSRNQSSKIWNLFPATGDGDEVDGNSSFWLVILVVEEAKSDIWHLI